MPVMRQKGAKMGRPPARLWIQGLRPSYMSLLQQKIRSKRKA